MICTDGDGDASFRSVTTTEDVASVSTTGGNRLEINGGDTDRSVVLSLQSSRMGSGLVPRLIGGGTIVDVGEIE